MMQTFSSVHRQQAGLRPSPPGMWRPHPTLQPVGVTMGMPVYVLVLNKGLTEAGYQAFQNSQMEELLKEELIKKALASRDQAGGKAIIDCDSRWSSQQWMGFSVEEYPSVEALQEHMKRLKEMNWWRYVENTTILGTARE